MANPNSNSKFLNILLKIFYVIFCSTFAAMAWTLIKTTSKKYHTGWDGIADVLGALFFGFMIGLILSIISLNYLTNKQIKIALLIFLILNAALTLYLALRPKPTNKIIKPESMVLPTSYLTKSNNGMGIAALKFEANKSIPFYGVYTHKSPIEIFPGDSIVLNDKANDLSYAPPWFLPRTYKPDYQVIYFNVLSITAHHYEIEVNHQNKRSTFIGKEDVRFLSWPEYILRANTLKYAAANNFDLYPKPIDGLEVRKIGNSNLLEPIRIKEDWVQVKFVDDMTNREMIGWLKWREGQELLVQINLFS